MNVRILEDITYMPQRFFIWLKTDIECPECGKEGLVVKYRCNGKIGFLHQSSGIILACENWGRCKSWWNVGTEEERFPWHTWISSFHKVLDVDRGNVGQKFLNDLSKSHKILYNKFISINNKIGRAHHNDR